MSKLLVANYKMNPRTAAEAVRLARACDAKNVVIAPPFPFIAAVGGVLKNAVLGAQDVFWDGSGAYTGEVSSIQLKALGVRYVIVGHSERRALGETDAMVNKKVGAALAAGLKVILCVGEPLAVRKRGFAAAKNFVKKQLIKDLRETTNYKLQTVRLSRAHRRGATNLLIAYEPLWAIGTGRAAKPADASAMAKFIKKLLTTHPSTPSSGPRGYSLPTVRVLYGGSVNAGNVGSFLVEPNIDGALVGGASLKPVEFKKMMRIASNS
ncbi:MAG: triose-phosphate isomerase [Candidatus Jorgensenbacteria bacterium]